VFGRFVLRYQTPCRWAVADMVRPRGLALNDSYKLANQMGSFKSRLQGIIRQWWEVPDKVVTPEAVDM
jgi:hypothetical protein